MAVIVMVIVIVDMGEEVVTYLMINVYFVTIQRIISRSALSGRNPTNLFKICQIFIIFSVWICLIC